MKRLENKEIELKFGEETMGYSDLATICMIQIPEGGVAPVEMARRISVIAKLDNAKIGDKIELEDAQFEMLKNLADSTHWKLIHKDIVAFNEYLDKLSK